MEAIGSKLGSFTFGELEEKYGAAVAAAAGTALSRMSIDATANSTGAAATIRGTLSFGNAGTLQGWESSPEGQYRIHGFKILPIVRTMSDVARGQSRVITRGWRMMEQVYGWADTDIGTIQSFHTSRVLKYSHFPFLLRLRVPAPRMLDVETPS